MKKITLITLLIFTVNITNSQINFDTEKNISSSNYLYSPGLSSVFSVDIDNDGDNDIISSYRSSILWHENENNEYFINNHQIVSYSSNQYINSIISFDVDNDGDNDIIATLEDADKVCWYENEDGNGTFSSEIIISENANGAFRIFSIDINKDGFIDIVVSYKVGDKVVWFKNIGNKTFSDEILIGENIDSPRGVYAIDMNNDNNTDILVASYNDNQIFWFESNYNGTNFTEHHVGYTSDAYDVKAFDIDNDGDSDIVAIGDDKISWFENNDLGELFIEHIINNNIFGGRTLQITDIDNDGDIDIASGAYYYPYNLMWYENVDESDDFESHVINSTSSGVQSMYAVDIDNDGDNDIVTADYGVCIYKNNNGMEHFDNPISINYSNNRFEHINIVDIDGDNDIDILTTTYDDAIGLFINYDGIGNYYIYKLIGFSDDIRQIETSDLDNDGDKDIIIAGYGAYETFWLENIDGKGNFSQKQILVSDYMPTSVRIFDFDNDGDKDIISFFSYPDRIYLNENIGGQNTFADPVLLIDDIDAFYLTTSDINGDGYVDIITGLWGQDENVVWYENNHGDGSFASAKIISTQKWWIHFVKCIDIDSDGDIDILSGSDSGYFLHKNNDNTFTDIFLSEEVRSGEYGIHPEDIDNDGDLDLVFTNTYEISNNNHEGYIYVLENIDGQGNFTEHSVAMSDWINEIRVADIDNDGDSDIISCRNDILWFENNLIESNITKIKDKVLQIFPNPTSGIINLEFVNKNIQKVIISDIVGKQIIENGNIQQNEYIDLSSFKNGIYIISIKTDNEIFTTKIVKE